MLFNCIMIFLGGLFSIVLFFAYDTYQDNIILRKKIEDLKNNRKDDKSE